MLDQSEIDGVNRDNGSIYKSEEKEAIILLLFVELYLAKDYFKAHHKDSIRLVATIPMQPFQLSDAMI